MVKHRLLIVDDDVTCAEGIACILRGKGGFTVDCVSDGDHGIALVRQNPGHYSLAIVDFLLPEGTSGPDTIAGIRRLDPALPVMGLSGDNSVDTHNVSIAAGADAFFVKGQPVMKLCALATRFCQRYEDETKIVHDSLSPDENIRSLNSMGFAGCSIHLGQVVLLIKKFGPTGYTVLVRGENGTGKELVARAIHDNSDRRGGPFIPVNMGAVSGTLFETELFGHEKGSFTGAIRSHVGYFQRAQGGTLFLDEIGDLPLEMQVKLLRAIQEREIMPVGSIKPVKVDVRIIAATNVNLEAAVKSGTFREDLYYRLNVFPIKLLPLRDRKEDIEPLVCAITKRYNDENGTSKKFLAKTVELLCNYNWPGNVRELQAEVQRILTVNGDIIAPRDLDKKFHLANQDRVIHDSPELEREIKAIEREFYRRKILETGSATRTAKTLNMSKSTLLRRLKELGIELE